MRTFCSKCFAESDPGACTCGRCGADLAQSAAEFEDKLLGALHHPIPDHQMTAVRVLGERQSTRAISEFAALLGGDVDYYLAREILLALRRIASPESERVLVEATRHRSRLVRMFAKKLASTRRPE